MEPLEFLRTVLPSPGHGQYCVFNAKGETKFNEFFDTTEELVKRFSVMVEREYDTYFGLATFEVPPGTKKGKGREAVNARFMRAFFLDFDGYADPLDAWNDLRAFLKAMGLWALGTPYLVKSGGGLHAYWPLDRDLEIAEWQPIANNFKRLCAQEKLKIDFNVPADAARVLRCPGTTNFKKNKDGTWKYGEPQPVEFVKPGSGLIDPYAFGDAIADKLTDEDVKPGSLNIPGVRQTGGPSVEIDHGNKKRFFRILEEKTAKGEGCAQLAYYHDNATEKVEPLWRGLLSLAKVCEDGWEWAQKLSAEHPYDEKELTAKWHAVGGPQFCTTFNENQPGICSDCPHWGKEKFTTPIILAAERAVNTESAEIMVEVPINSDVEQPTRTIYRPEPPKDFSYGDYGGVFGPVYDKNGKVKHEHVPILPYALYVTELLNAQGSHGAQFVAEHPLGQFTFELKAKTIGSKEECLKALMEHRVTSSIPAWSGSLHNYVWACYSDACNERKAVAVPDHYGWQPDGSFVHAGKVFRKDKEPVVVPMHDLENIIEVTRPVGSLAAWKAYIDMIIVKQPLNVLAAFLMGSCSPLMRFTPQAGMTVHCCSRKSGTGKTLSLRMNASIWGHPKLYPVGQKTSVVAMDHRLGLLHSLPFTVDEITERTRKDPEWFANHLLSMTEGKGKERMEAGTSKERLNRTSWASIAHMTSNTKALDFLTIDRTHSAEGELYRLIEFRMPEKEIVWTDEERKLKYALENNYGCAGYVLAQWMVDNADRLPGMVEAGMIRARDYFSLRDNERFWEANIGASIAWAQVLKEAVGVTLPLDLIFNEIMAAIQRMRAEINGTEVTVDELMWEYIQNNYAQLIVVQHMENETVVDMPFRNKEQELSLLRGALMGRIDRDKPKGWTAFTIPQKLMRKHCSTRNMDYGHFIAELTKFSKSIMVEEKRPDMLAGTKVGRTAGVRPLCLVVSMRNDEVAVELPGQVAMGED